MSIKPKTTEEVFELLDASFTSAALGTAMELGLFWFLDKKPLNVKGISKELEIPVNRCRYWLQLLIKTGLIEKIPGGYAPTSKARTTILDAYGQETWAFLAREGRERFPAINDLPVNIRKPGSAWEAQGLTPPNYFTRLVESPERARSFTRMLYEIHLPMADEIAKILNMKKVTRLMDLGGGSGVVSIALLRKYSNITSVVIDIENVCKAGREIAKENSLQDRINYYEADFIHDDIPSGFDMILVCDVNVYSLEIFNKIKKALNSDGRLVIIDQFAPADNVAPRSRVHWAFQSSMINPDSAFPTADKVKTMLEGLGFKIFSENPLPKSESVRWSEDWEVLEAG